MQTFLILFLNFYLFKLKKPLNIRGLINLKKFNYEKLYESN